jgi:hypothetical protein
VVDGEEYARWVAERRALSEFVIRPQEERDAAAVTALQREVDDALVTSEAGWRHRQRRRNPRDQGLELPLTSARRLLRRARRA